MLYKRYLKYFLPRVLTTFRYKLSRPMVMNRTNRNTRVSVFSPFMAFSFGLIGSSLAVENQRKHKGLFNNNENITLADLYEDCTKSVVHLRLEIKSEDESYEKKTLVSNGSGFIIRQDGLILTNAHVVCDMSIKSKLKIRYHDGRVIVGQVVCIDPLSDLAIVKPLEPPQDLTNYPPVNFRDTDLRVGDSVFAIGSPFGLLNTMSAGVVSGLERNYMDLIRITNDSRVKYLQTDLHLFPGNSGGPIFDCQGQVVGISTVRSESEGLSFAIQTSNGVKKIIDQMIASGKVRRAWLGFRGISLNPEIIEQIDNLTKQNELNVIKHGVLVLRSYENSPAVAADILPGDVIVSINDRTVKDIGELLAVLDDSPIDETTKLTIKRIVFSNNNGVRTEKIVERICYIKPDEYDIFTHKDRPYN